jgi:light-regulated signal transduction histidine kinase (bacteriophytochrome)
LIKSLLSLKDRKVIAFSATTSPSHERFINNIIGHPIVLKFKSEYELVKGVSPVSDPTIVMCLTDSALHDSMALDIAKHYDQHPIIAIADDQYRGRLVEHLKANKYKYAEGGSLQVLASVRSWEYGILILSREEGRGVDTRFKRDAFVLITGNVSNHHELL